MPRGVPRAFIGLGTRDRKVSTGFSGSTRHWGRTNPSRIRGEERGGLAVRWGPVVGGGEEADTRAQGVSAKEPGRGGARAGLVCWAGEGGLGAGGFGGGEFWAAADLVTRPRAGDSPFFSFPILFYFPKHFQIEDKFKFGNQTKPHSIEQNYGQHECKSMLLPL